MLFIYPMIFITIVSLIYLVYDDLKTREVNVAFIFLISGVGFLYNLYFGIVNNFLKLYLLQLLIVIVFLLIIYIAGKITIYAYIGEGDLWTLLMISCTSGYAVLFSEFVLLLSLAFMFFIPLVFFIYNMSKKNYPDKILKEKFWIMFLGFPKNISKINNFFTPLEEFRIVNGKIESQMIIKPNCDPTVTISKLKEFSEIYKIKKVWVSPLIPFVWPILIAYIFILFLILFNELSWLGFFATIYI